MKKSILTSLLLGLSLTACLFAEAMSFQGAGQVPAAPAAYVKANEETATKDRAQFAAAAQNALRYDETEAYQEAYRKTKETCKPVFPKNPLYSKGINYQGKEVELTVQTAEAQRFYNDVSQGQLKPVEELKTDPVVLLLDCISEENTKAIGGVTADIDTPERAALRAAICRDFLQNGSARKTENGRYVYDGKVKKEYRACIVFGLPASGKTSFVESFSEKEGMFVFDKDMIKAMIPECAATGGALDDAVHREGTSIANKAFREFLSGSHKGDNIVIQTTGDHAKPLIERYLKPLVAAGYDVKLKYIDADLKVSANRVVMRAIETGRIISSKAILNYGTKPAETYEWFKSHEAFRKFLSEVEKEGTK